MMKFRAKHDEQYETERIALGNLDRSVPEPSSGEPEPGLAPWVGYPTGFV